MKTWILVWENLKHFSLHKTFQIYYDHDFLNTQNNQMHMIQVDSELGCHHLVNVPLIHDFFIWLVLASL